MRYEKKIDINEVVGHFDRSAKTYEDVYKIKSSESYAFNVRKKIVTNFLPHYCGKILDVGCGPGIMVDVIKDRAEIYVGIDSAEAMIKECTKKYLQDEKIIFEKGNAEAINWENNFFDISLCMGVLEYLNNDWLTIKEIIRVTKNFGKIIITLPNKKSPYRIWRQLIYIPARFFFRFYLKRKAIPKEELIPHREYSFRKIDSKLRKLGCRVDKVEYYNFKVIPSPFDKWSSKLDLKLLYNLEKLHSTRLNWLGTGMVLKIIKCE